MPLSREISKDEWGTPPEVFKALDREFKFTLDPCASPIRPLKEGFTSLFKVSDGLSQSWAGHRVFCDPPYSDRQIATWVKKAFAERQNAEVIVMLIPVRTDRKYFHNYIINHAEIRFIKGRPSFIPLMGQNKGTPSFPSMIIIFRAEDVITKGLSTLDMEG